MNPGSEPSQPESSPHPPAPSDPGQQAGQQRRPIALTPKKLAVVGGAIAAVIALIVVIAVSASGDDPKDTAEDFLQATVDNDAETACEQLHATMHLQMQRYLGGDCVTAFKAGFGKDDPEEVETMRRMLKNGEPREKVGSDGHPQVWYQDGSSKLEMTMVHDGDSWKIADAEGP